MAKIIITGDKELDRKLRALGPKVANKIVTQAMRANMKPLEKRVKENAPVLSGNMKASVKLRFGKASRKVKSIQVFVSREAFKGELKGDSFYPAAVEFGSDRQKPNGFYRRAYDEMRQPILDNTMRDIAAGIVIAAAQG